MELFCSPFRAFMVFLLPTSIRAAFLSCSFLSHQAGWRLPLADYFLACSFGSCVSHASGRSASLRMFWQMFWRHLGVHWKMLHTLAVTSDIGTPIKIGKSDGFVKILPGQVAPCKSYYCCLYFSELLSAIGECGIRLRSSGTVWTAANMCLLSLSACSHRWENLPEGLPRFSLAWFKLLVLHSVAPVALCVPSCLIVSVAVDHSHLECSLPLELCGRLSLQRFTTPVRGFEVCPPPKKKVNISAH